MGAYYDEIEIEDMSWDSEKRVFHYPCPCGDRFEISRKQLSNYEDVATCPSCSLIIRVIYDPLDYEDEEEEGDAAAESEEEQDVEEADDDGDGDEGADCSDDDHFEDALENLHISNEATPVVSVAA